MKARQQDISVSLPGLWHFFQAVLSFRQPMPIAEVKVLLGSGFYVCPRCSLTIDREFMAFCDRCGQCLDWRHYKKARIIYPNRKQS